MHWGSEMATMYQPFLTSDQVQDLRRATELAAARGVQRFARQFSLILFILVPATAVIVHALDVWLMTARCVGR